MTLIDFMNLVPETQEIMLCYEGFCLDGSCDALGCMLCEDVYKGVVTGIEADKDVLKIWVKEACSDDKQ